MDTTFLNHYLIIYLLIKFILILGEIKAQGKWLRKTLIPWFHALRERRIKVGDVHKRGAHGDGVLENIKVNPP